MAVGCGQKEEYTTKPTKLSDSGETEMEDGETTINKTVDVEDEENENNKIEEYTVERNGEFFRVRINKDTTEFGIYPETETYRIADSEERRKEHVQNVLYDYFGMGGYVMVGDGSDIATLLLIYSEENEAFVLKSIELKEGSLEVIVCESEPNALYAQSEVYITVTSPFDEYQIIYEDGTPLRNLADMPLNSDTAVFLGVDYEKGEMTLIPNGATITYTYNFEDIPADVFESLEENDEIELIEDIEKDIIYAIRKIEE
ncbi:MAG: hypothetical protein GX359_07540 [Clostridiales bacterium]|nr:hypothetical protein [Clostridiales bacterium]